MSVTLQAQGTIMSGLNGSLQTKTGAFTLTSTKLKHRTKQAFNESTRKNRDKRRKRLIAH